jgi:ATP-dependent RNA helicase DBP3
MGSSSKQNDSKEIVKAAKKILKKNDSLDVDKLSKMVFDKTKGVHSLSDINTLISSNKKFVITSSDNDSNKSVSLKSKKSKKRTSTSEENTNTKRAKTNDNSTKVDTSSSLESIQLWRKENKIVLKETFDNNSDETTAEASQDLSTCAEYLPYNSFDHSRCKDEIHPLLLKQCTESNGFLKPSPIQAQCWPVLCHADSSGKRRDIVGIAETGSGKTLAFSLPALTALARDSSNLPVSKRRTPRMLVLAPTRELAMQSHVVLEEFGSLLSLKSLVVYGGVPKNEQKSALKRGVDCVVATPGRIKDLINEGDCVLSHVTQLVLDEADRMLDMGFEEDVRFIISKCKPKENGRQTAMFSATWPAAIQKIALEYMINPVRVYVGFEAIVGSNGENALDDSLSANKRVTQNVEVLDDRARMSRLRQLLNQHCSKHDKKNQNRILIFALYKKEAERLEQDLQRDGWDGLVSSIHGNKSQDGRTRALESFKEGSCPLMVATDVAARGLDIPNVEVVINYTFPLTIEDYVHRIGRTGRAGKKGVSYTFFQPSDKSHAGELQQVMKQAGQDVPEELMKFGSTIKKKEHKLYGNFGPSSLPMKKAVKITFDSDDE